MHHFKYRKNTLYCEDVPLASIAEKYGTPVYVYSKSTLLRHVRKVEESFGDVPHLLCYSVKANTSGAILSLFAYEGIGIDVVSGGELYRGLKAGFKPDNIVYSGVGKTPNEIHFALERDILMFNVESWQELEEINRIACEMGRKARISFRVNPDVDPKTHPYIATGLRISKFGIPWKDALETYCEASKMPDVSIIGIDAHIGSQITEIAPFREAMEKLVDLVGQITSSGIDLKYLDIGGGLGIRYRDETPPEPAKLMESLIPILEKSGLTLIFEPGRSIVGNAGIFLTKVLYIKKGEEKTFVIIDGAMNDLMRPVLYDAHHDILPVEKKGAPAQVVDVVGPVCESGDFMAKDREMRVLKRGELLAVMGAGAYGYSMASNYNSRPRPPEVMVENDNIIIIRERETIEDLIAGEKNRRIVTNQLTLRINE